MRKSALLMTLLASAAVAAPAFADCRSDIAAFEHNYRFSPRSNTANALANAKASAAKGDERTCAGYVKEAHTHYQEDRGNPPGDRRSSDRDRYDRRDGDRDERARLDAEQRRLDDERARLHDRDRGSPGSSGGGSVLDELPGGSPSR
jgi:hypothetical protein